MQRMHLRANNPRDVNNRGESVGVNAGAFGPPSVTSAGFPGPSRLPNDVTNLESFLKSVTPVVTARMPSSETDSKKEAEMRPYFCIGDLWNSFEQWSAYGAGVPFVLNGHYQTTQFYVPFLSGMQLFIDPTKMKIGSVCEENGVNQKGKQIVSTDNGTEVYGSRSKLVFQYIEYERPHTRMPLSALAASLESKFPELSKYRSCDLLPSSWICVAWYTSYLTKWSGLVDWVTVMMSTLFGAWQNGYPIYRIPMGPSMDDLEACFLTLHGLSTHPKNYNEGESSNGNTHAIHVEVGRSSTIRLPVFGMVPYKLRGSIISPTDRQECEQNYFLLNAAINWLNNVKTHVPDYWFFINQYK